MDNLFKSEKVYSVSELNTTAKNLLRAEFSEYIWVCGEIQDLRSRQHINFNLVQKHENLDEIVAQVKTVIFENVKTQIFKRLKEADSNLVLKDDIEVKLLCKVDLYVKTGQFSLSVFDIDPVYTLGKVAQNRLKIIEELKAKGLLEKNKQKFIPQVPLRIGLITSLESAAYHDFVSELKTSGYNFSILAFDSFMQGKAVEASVTTGINFFNNLADNELDVIVVSRGGGSTADLAAFDNKKIAESIANCKFAVISALGHEINTTITDIVAHTSLKTPTKAAQFLVESIGDFSDILDNFKKDIFEASAEIFSQKKQNLEETAIKIDSLVPRFFRVHRDGLIQAQASLLNSTNNRLREAKISIKDSFSVLSDSLNKIFKNSQDLVKYMEEKIGLLNPRNVLKRGYSITYKANKAVKSIEELGVGDLIKTVFYKGVVTSSVKNKE